MQTETTEVLNEIKKEIKRRNQAFKKATKAEKRVLIAQDVIEQVKKGKFNPACGVYVDSWDIRRIILCDSDNMKKSLQKEFLKPDVTCRVCGLGSLMVSCTLFNNKETFEDFYDDFEDLGTRINNDSSIKNGFLDIFSKKQLDLIETAFECWPEKDYYYIKGERDELLSRAYEFGIKYDDDADRLCAIMANIIQHKGEFKP